MVEPTDGAEVESGELRWPPDEPSSPDAQTERPSTEEETAGEEESQSMFSSLAWSDKLIRNLLLSPFLLAPLPVLFFLVAVVE